MSSQLWMRMAGDINCTLFRYVCNLYLVSLKKSVVKKLNNPMWLNMVENLCLCILKGKIIWIFFKLTAKNRPAVQKNVNTYGGRSHIYLLQLCI